MERKKLAGIGASLFVAGGLLLTRSIHAEARTQDDPTKGMDGKPLAKEVGDFAATDCFLDTMLGERNHDAGTPPNLYFEIANSCAKQGEVGYLNEDGTIEGYARVILENDYDYVDRAGELRTFRKGTVVYFPR